MLMNENTILTIVIQKIKKFISLLGAEMLRCMLWFVYQVTTVKASSETSVDKIFAS